MSDEAKTVRMTEEDLEVFNVILKIPKEAIGLTVTAKLLENDKVVEAVRELSVSEIHDARQDFLDNVADGDDYDVFYTLTDKGRAELEKMKRQET